MWIEVDGYHLQDAVLRLLVPEQALLRELPVNGGVVPEPLDEGPDLQRGRAHHGALVVGTSRCV